LRWRIAAAHSLTWRQLDDETVVRSERTGSTHLLDSLAAELLHTLLAAQAPMSADELAATITGEEEEPAQELSSSIEATLLEFKRLGIAEPSD
jgi:PqqD family protein of HPr-rel-A system